MKLARTARPRDEDARILPLINVVFLLLVFFMLAGQFAGGDPFAVDPPATRHALPLDGGPPEILAAADGTLALDGQVTTIDALLAALPARLADAPGSGVRIRADGDLSANAVARLLGDLRGAGVRQVSLVTLAAATQR